MDSFLIGTIMTGAVGMIFAVWGIYMALTGRGSFMIAARNAAKKEKLKKYNTTAISKFVGKIILLPTGLLTVMFALGLSLNAGHDMTLVRVMIVTYAVITAGLCIFAVVYINIGKRFKN